MPMDADLSMVEWMNEWTNKWMNEWTNEWMNKYIWSTTCHLKNNYE